MNIYSHKEIGFLKEMGLGVNKVDPNDEIEKLKGIVAKMKQVEGKSNVIIVIREGATLKSKTNFYSRLNAIVKEQLYPIPQNITYSPREIILICDKRLKELDPNNPFIVKENEVGIREKPVILDKAQIRTFIVKNNEVDIRGRKKEPVILDAAQIKRIYAFRMYPGLKDIEKIASDDYATAQKLYNKIIKKHPELNKPEYERGLKITSFLLAHKINADHGENYNSQSFAIIFNIPISQINEMELLFLNALNWEVTGL